MSSSAAKELFSELSLPLSLGGGGGGAILDGGGIKIPVVDDNDRGDS